VLGDTVLVYVKGDAGGDGRSHTQSGSGVFIPANKGMSTCHRQESDNYDKSTFRRAELHAAIAAVRHPWEPEGYSKIVIATDSNIIIGGITGWISKWQRNGWLTSKNTPVKHQDLWRELWQAIQDSPVAVQFYLISRDHNKAAPFARQGMVSTNNLTVLGSYAISEASN
jgi:ribonuclease HI